MKHMLTVFFIFIFSLLIVAGVIVWYYPLDVYEQLSRTGLWMAGFEKAVISAPRGRLVYWHGGTGQTVVLLHGANDQAGSWAQIAKALKAKYRVLVPDLPGHGSSEPLKGTLSIGDVLEGLDRLLEAELHAEKVTLVGNSMGGWVALLYALRHPDRVSHVVLENGVAIRREGIQVTMMPSNRAEARMMMEALTGPDAPRFPTFVLDHLVRRAPTSPLARLVQSGSEGFSLEGRLHEISAPVTLLWGEADQLLPLAYAKKVADQLPVAMLKVVPRCGHVPHRECRAFFLPLLEESLYDVPEGSAHVLP
jgi:2-hydroxy-6-oxonona-2,4-dienedioate hydrolase